MSILDFLFPPARRQQKLATVQPVVPDNETEPAQVMSVRTLVIVYEPTMDSSSGDKLSRYMRWNSVEDLAKGYMSDVLLVS